MINVEITDIRRGPVTKGMFEEQNLRKLSFLHYSDKPYQSKNFILIYVGMKHHTQQLPAIPHALWQGKKEKRTTIGYEKGIKGFPPGED